MFTKQEQVNYVGRYLQKRKNLMGRSLSFVHDFKMRYPVALGKLLEGNHK